MPRPAWHVTGQGPRMQHPACWCCRESCSPSLHSIPLDMFLPPCPDRPSPLCVGRHLGLSALKPEVKGHDFLFLGESTPDTPGTALGGGPLWVSGMGQHVPALSWDSGASVFQLALGTEQRSLVVGVETPSGVL